MARKYELKRRAARQAQTRRRIVEAAITLHRTKGPSRTTISDVARLAGVQRHTLYRHFSDEKELGLACSGHYMEDHPPPDAKRWLSIADTDKRRRIGLTELYTWFKTNEEMLGAALRDAEVHSVTREMFELRVGAAMGGIRETLAVGLARNKRTHAVLDLALDFYTWRSLDRSGLSPTQAADVMADALNLRR